MLKNPSSLGRSFSLLHVNKLKATELTGKLFMAWLSSTVVHAKASHASTVHLYKFVEIVLIKYYLVFVSKSVSPYLFADCDHM